MALTSIQFLIFVTAGVFAFHSHSSSRYRRWVLTVLNIIFLASFVDHASQLAPLLVFLTIGFLALRTTSQRRSTLAGVWIAFIVALFVYLKRYAFLGPLPTLPFSYLGIGLSYILFRMLQLVIDRTSGEAGHRLTLREFFDYTCNFLTFISGPIQRSEGFLIDQANISRSVDASVAFRSFSRVILGYFKVVVISACANYVFENVSNSLLHVSGLVSGSQAVVNFSLSVASYTAYLYYNFAGYMDIVIGVGWLVGQDLPENFDHPFRARNLFEFWSRWHMTLSEWFKTYLFNPLLGALASRVAAPGALPFLGVIAFFVTFFVMGVWHGSTLVFVIYGLVMGAGVSINKIWQMLLTRTLGRKRYRALGDRWLYSAAARGVTCAFFSMAVTALWVDVHQLSLISSRLGLAGLGASFAGLATLGAFVFPLSDWAGNQLRRSTERMAPVLQAPMARQLRLAAGVLAIFVVNSFFHKAPEFVYKAF